MDTDNGGWTTIQRRYDGTVDFHRSWDDYKAGFGNIAGEHWLGNSNLHAILRQRSYQARFDVEDFQGIQRMLFTMRYMLVMKVLSNAMVDYAGTPMNGMMFTTRDRDNDISNDYCGNSKKSGWWHAGCTYANLNGGVYTDEFLETSIHWKTWKETALKGTRIMIKPKP
ncbi:Ficolin-2 [Mytilus coruscus]|uniref:Ficolin-2 n=1 Tax=Mytilus coruscus TaxID=42192 RepID=A0A6J8DT28_MYTCO|nr:Ficolin-2 [Mytilus coruscus]